MNDTRLDAAVVLLLVCILGGCLAALVFLPIPPDNMPLFAALASGVVGAGVGSFIGYRYGSSKSSATKDQAIADLAKGQG